ncbi:MAG: hypothetical protein OQK13_03575, partial [Gammaproteobacteria bacterium]|nr:hypothetical protein [Gammaproteobacteria bacterium]
GMVQGDVLLITDGTDDNCGERCITAASEVNKAGYRLSVIAVGTVEGAPIPTAKGYLKDSDGTIVIPKLDDMALRDMVISGGGRFSPLRGDDADIDTVLSLTQTVTSQTMESSGEESQQWYESGPWLLILLLPLAALFYRRGILVIPLLIILTPKGEAFAAEEIGSSLWLNDNQRAERLLESGRADEAVELFDNKKWQAAAHYRAGHFEESAKLLEGDLDITSQYNYGNAQARLGKFPAAIKSYESVLDREPNHEDARYNLELLKKMMQQQQNRQQSDDASDQQQGESEQQDSGDGASSPDGESGEQDSEQGGGEQNSEQDSAEGDQESEAQQSGEQSEDAQSGTAAEQPESAEQDDESAAQAQEREQPQGEQSDEGELGESTEQRYQPKGDANEQWLRQIPDDPGGLLRRKFKYQYQQSYKDRERDIQPW